MPRNIRTQRGFSLLELLIVVSLVGIVAIGTTLWVRENRRHQIDKGVVSLQSAIQQARSAADLGKDSESERTANLSAVILPLTVQLGGKEYSHDLPLDAPLITSPTVVFEPQSGRTKDKVYGFVVLKCPTEQEERAIYIPYLPGPMLVYTRRGGEKIWSSSESPLY